MTPLKIPDGPDTQSRPVGKVLLRPATPHPKSHQQTAKAISTSVQRLNRNVIHARNPCGKWGVPP